MTNEIKAPELARASLGANPESGPVVAVTVDPTQVRRPWRSTVRTAFQVIVGLATLIPFVVAGVYSNEADYPAVIVQVLAVTSAITRVMALPQVEEFLRTFVPFLSAAGKQPSI